MRLVERALTLLGVQVDLDSGVTTRVEDLADDDVVGLARGETYVSDRRAI
jgi:hypothetical protein